MQENPSEPNPATKEAINKWTCAASCHMRGMTFAVYNVARSVSANSGKMYCSAEYIASRYEGMSQTTVYKHLAILQAKGWLILTKERVWLSDGTTSTNQYRVLKHEEWAASHPGMCNPPIKKAKKRPSPETGTGEEPSPETGVTFTNPRNHLHQELVSSLTVPSIKEQILKNPSGIPKPSPALGEGGNGLGQQISEASHYAAQPSPETGTGAAPDTAADVDATIERFQYRRRPKQPVAPQAETVPQSSGVSSAGTGMRWSGSEGSFVDYKNQVLPIREVDRRLATVGLRYITNEFFDSHGKVQWEDAQRRIAGTQEAA